MCTQFQKHTHFEYVGGIFSPKSVFFFSPHSKILNLSLLTLTLNGIVWEVFSRARIINEKIDTDVVMFVW